MTRHSREYVFNPSCPECVNGLHDAEETYPAADRIYSEPVYEVDTLKAAIEALTATLTAKDAEIEALRMVVRCTTAHYSKTINGALPWNQAIDRITIALGADYPEAIKAFLVTLNPTEPEEDEELPGMWERADLTGGEADGYSTQS